MRWGRAPLALAAAAAGLLALPVAAAALPARAAGPARPAAGWSGSAAADGVRVSVVIKDFLVVSDIVDAGGPVAQAAASDYYGAQGLAAYPYPGQVVMTAHGLAQQVPSYPLVAQSNNSTQPRSEVSHGPYDLMARSSDDSSQALAQAAPGGGGIAAGATISTANTVRDPHTGIVTSDASSTVEGISVNGVLHIGRLHSAAHLVAVPGAAPKAASDTEIADVTVGGQQVGVTNKGLVLAGTDVPLPADSTAAALLTGAGVTVRYLSCSTTPTSMVAPGLSVSAVQNVPGVGLTTVTYLLGQASVSAAAPAAAALSGVVPAQIGPPAPATPGASAGSAAASTSSVPTGPLGGGLVTGPSPAPAPVTAGAVPGVQSGGYRLAAASGASSASLYVVVAVGAVVMAAAAQLFRVLAVRLAWT